MLTSRFIFIWKPCFLMFLLYQVIRILVNENGVAKRKCYGKQGLKNEELTKNQPHSVDKQSVVLKKNGLREKGEEN